MSAIFEKNCAPKSSPTRTFSGVITRGSMAELIDLDTLESMTLTLVLPTTRVLTMLGYAEGSTFEWNVPGGLKRTKISKV